MVYRITESSTARPTRLLDQVRDAVRRKHYSLRTEQTYVHWIKRFICFHGKRHPRDLGEQEVTAGAWYTAGVARWHRSREAPGAVAKRAERRGGA